jgi:hypothetical protein
MRKIRKQQIIRTKLIVAVARQGMEVGVNRMYNTERRQIRVMIDDCTQHGYLLTIARATVGLYQSRAL